MQWQGSSAGAEWAAMGSVRFRPDRRAGGLTAYGEQSTCEYELAWQLSTAAGWVFDRLEIRLLGLPNGSPRLNRTLLLQRGSAGDWRATAWRHDSLDLPGPGLVDPAVLASVRDVVISSCPLTHTAPLRRVGLLAGFRRARVDHPAPLSTKPVLLPVARVLLPSLTVVPARQIYQRVAQSPSGSTVRHSFVGDTSPADGRPRSALMEVDEQGVVLSYDGLARVGDSAMVA